MAKVHRRGDPRACGAVTTAGGDNTKVFVGGLLAAVVGDLDSHSNLGALISMSPGTILIKGVPMIVSMLDNAAPDQIGLIQHVTNFPTPFGGSNKVQAYGGLGQFGGGLGNFGLSGMLSVGEMVTLGGQVIGQVQKVVTQSGTSGLTVLSNVSTAPTAGQTITGQSSNNTFTFSSFET